MQTLKAIQYFSGTLPSGQTVTLHTGNERRLDEGDAQWLLAEYPERFEQVLELSVHDSNDSTAPNSVPMTETETSEAAETFVTGAPARPGKGKSKKG